MLNAGQSLLNTPNYQFKNNQNKKLTNLYRKSLEPNNFDIKNEKLFKNELMNKNDNDG